MHQHVALATEKRIKGMKRGSQAYCYMGRGCLLCTFGCDGLATRLDQSPHQNSDLRHRNPGGGQPQQFREGRATRAAITLTLVASKSNEGYLHGMKAGIA